MFPCEMIYLSVAGEGLDLSELLLFYLHLLYIMSVYCRMADKIEPYIIGIASCLPSGVVNMGGYCIAI